MHRACLLPLILFAGTVSAQSDRAVAENAIAASAAVCPGHALDRTGPTVRAVPVGALRVLDKHGVVLCPDRRLEGDAKVVFHPRYGVYAWNPDDAASSRALVQVIDAATRNEEFPAELSVWDAEGKPLREQLVPTFEPKPNAPLNRWLGR